MISETIEQNLKQAMRDHNQIVIDTLRLLKTRIKNEEISKQKTFNDQEILPLVSSEIKRRKDSIELYKNGGRSELAAKEEQEIEVLKNFLPEQLSEAQVSEIIDGALSNALAAGQTFTAVDFGKAMAAVMPELKGKADGALISKLLKEKLK